MLSKKFDKACEPLYTEMNSVISGECTLNEDIVKGLVTAGEMEELKKNPN